VKTRSPNRPQRVAEQVQRELSGLISRELRDPRLGLVTLTGVELTPDYAHARVWFTSIGSAPGQSAAGLNAAAGHLHNLLFRRIRIHTVPRLHFVEDTSVARGFAMDQLIAQALATDAPAPGPAAADEEVGVDGDGEV